MHAHSSSMDFFAHLIDSWFWFLYFCFTSKEARQNTATVCSNQHYYYPFILSVERFCHKRKQKNLRIDWEMMYAIHLKLESN